jgi:hypothetical protein
MGSVFAGKRRLLPRLNDLSFYNWHTQQTKANSSVNYEVLTDRLPGVMFKNKRDRKVVLISLG